MTPPAGFKVRRDPANASRGSAAGTLLGVAGHADFSSIHNHSAYALIEHDKDAPAE